MLISLQLCLLLNFFSYFYDFLHCASDFQFTSFHFLIHIQSIFIFQPQSFLIHSLFLILYLTQIPIMTDPVQFIVEQQILHKVLTHQGVLGKGRDFLTGSLCSLHLYNDKFKRTYVMQQFEGVDQNFVSQKMTRIAKTVHSHFVCNLTKACFVSTRKNQKGLFDLSIFYDATGVYGFSLEYIIKMKIKNEQKFEEQQIIGFFWQIADFILLNGKYTGEYLEVTPVNIFCKTEEYYGYNFFPNNFGLNFSDTKWERRYYNPKDRFWNGQKTLESCLRATMFIFGMVLLELCCLIAPTDLYSQKFINQKVLLKRIEGIKLTNNPLICQVIKLLLVLNEDERITIDKIYLMKDLLKTRKVDYMKNKAGIYQFKSFQGMVSVDQKSAVGEGLDEKMCLIRGRFEKGRLEGLGMKESQDHNIQIGLFENGKLNQGMVIKKNQSIKIISEQGQLNKGIMVKLNIGMLKSEGKNLVAFEGQFDGQKPLYGKMYYSDGTQQQI